MRTLGVLEPGNGVGVFRGRSCGLHLGGVAGLECCPEDPVQGRDAGELQEPSVPGALHGET